MSILISNDDGFGSPGIRALYDALRGLDDLWLAAPADQRSGVSHAFTLHKALRVDPVDWVANGQGFAVHGMPVDAVKLGISTFMPAPPRLVVSGINSGANSGVDILYSGTVAAAMEANLLGINAIAFSLTSKTSLDYSIAAGFARQLCERVLAEGLPEGVLLNVNIPAVPQAQIKGVRVTSLAKSRYGEPTESSIISINGGKSYLVDYRKELIGDNTDSDMVAIQQNYISVTPVHARLTEHSLIPQLEKWELELVR